MKKHITPMISSSGSIANIIACIVIIISIIISSYSFYANSTIVNKETTKNEFRITNN